MNKYSEMTNDEVKTEYANAKKEFDCSPKAWDRLLEVEAEIVKRGLYQVTQANFYNED